MIPLADTHVHLLAGLDDGPPTTDVALAMCRALVNEGARFATALRAPESQLPRQHRGPAPRRRRRRSWHCWRRSTFRYRCTPRARSCSRRPRSTSGGPGNCSPWAITGSGSSWKCRTVGASTCCRSRTRSDQKGCGSSSHAERNSELLDDLALCAQWIEAGCLFQVSAPALAQPWEPGFELALKRWAKGGFIHLMGSDGHGIDRRRPELAGGFERLAKWVGRSHAARIASTWGRAVLEGEPINVPRPRPNGRSWFTRLFGG